jgi:hypothetical protein
MKSVAGMFALMSQAGSWDQPVIRAIFGKSAREQIVDSRGGGA